MRKCQARETSEPQRPKWHKRDSNIQCIQPLLLSTCLENQALAQTFPNRNTNKYIVQAHRLACSEKRRHYRLNLGSVATATNSEVRSYQH
jgi:hypothetical protein